MSDKPTGKDVRDMKQSELAPTPKKNKSVPAGTKQVQIHAGNLGVVQTQLMSEINVNLGRIAKCLEIFLKENPPKKE